MAELFNVAALGAIMSYQQYYESPIGLLTVCANDIGVTRVAFTSAYADIANAIGNPKAVRAVGAANGKNAIPIIVPCHRVIGRNGSLTGFAFGTERKAWLLEHEGINLL